MAIVDYFLKIEGIPGDSPDVQHKDEIALMSFSFGVHNTAGAATGGAGAGKATFSDFVITKGTDKASPNLFLKCASGAHIKSAVLTARKAGGEGTSRDFLKVTFSDVLISSYLEAGQGSTQSRPPVDVVPNLATSLVTNAALTTGGAGNDAVDNVSLRYAKLDLTQGTPQRIGVPPTGGGTLTFNAKTNTVTLGDWNGDGVAVVGNIAGNTTRAVQEFDVKVLIGLLTAPFSTARLRLFVNQVQSAQPPGEIIRALASGGERQGPVPHLRFDVLLYRDADGVIDASDLTRPGKRIGQLLVDPSDPNSLASLNLDLGAILLRFRDDTFGIRIQLHGAGLPEPFESGPGDEGPEESDEGPEEGRRNVSASFTMAVVLDTAT